MLIFYHYSKCSTCVKAKKYLVSQGRALKEIDITAAPPNASDLAKLIAQSGRPYTDFLNRSGIQYRERNMKEKVKQLSEGKIVEMLSSEGRLIKRPIVTDGTQVTVGFNEAEFKRTWATSRSS